MSKRWRILALMCAFALVAVACGDDDDDNGDAGGGNGGNGDLEGTTVEIFGAFVDAEADAFQESLAAFEEESGITIEYEGTPDFANLIRVRTQGGDAPDIAMFPQPGLMADIVRGGGGIALDGDLLETVEANYSDVWLDLGQVDGDPYAVWFKAAVKSIVWYPVAEFEDAGYEIPETWDDLLALTDQIAGDGTTPWCIGIEDSGATGWVATDWVEDLMLRLHGGEVYDQWVNHEIDFDDPQVVEAVEAMGEIWLNDDYVYGGTQSILTTPFGDAPNAMFDDPPNCFLHRQATFISTFFPDDVQETLSGDSPAALPFFLPGTSADDRPVLGTGDAAVMMDDRPEVRAVMEYLATPESGEAWAQSGGYFSPHQGFDTSLYPTQAEQLAQEYLTNATEFRYDGSDLMPGEVGAGSFWTAMVEYVNGRSAEDVLGEVESGWPS